MLHIVKAKEQVTKKKLVLSIQNHKKRELKTGICFNYRKHDMEVLYLTCKESLCNHKNKRAERQFINVRKTYLSIHSSSPKMLTKATLQYYFKLICD